MSRTKRKPYTKTKAFDPACHGRDGCPACVGNRAHANKQRADAADAQLNEASQASLVEAPV